MLSTNSGFKTELFPSSIGPPLSDGFKAGLSEIFQIALQVLEEHDKSFANHNRDEWQVEYSLRKHTEDDIDLMDQVSLLREYDEYRRMVRKVGTLYHDKGKIDEEMWGYRRNRELSPDERVVVNQHPTFSGRRLRELQQRVSRMYHLLLRDAYPIAYSHHCPRMIDHPQRRQDGFDLFFVDKLVARRERRYRNHEVLSLDAAVEAIELDVMLLSDDPLYTPYRIEMENSRDSILELKRKGLIPEVKNR